MATQRPPWFRMPTMRPSAPAPPRPPALVRPAIPIRPPPPSQPSSPPPQPPTPPPSKPTSPVASTNFAPPPPRSPVAPRRSPPGPAAAPPPPSSPIAPRPSPPPPPSSPPLTKANIQQKSPSSEIKTTQSANNNNVKQATPISSPKTLQTPPSPLQLPPPQMVTRPDHKPKIDQKSVLVQENMDNPPTKTNNVHIHKGKREPPPPPSPTKDMDKATNTIKKVVSESEDLGMRIITIAGDNRGALMEISSSKGKTNPASRGKGRGRGRGYTLGNKSVEQGKSDDHDGGDKEQNEWQPMATFLNSNVQGLNNSIVFNSNCHHNNPGIHLSLIRKNLNANADGSRHG